jgi:hypothetical protein
VRSQTEEHFMAKRPANPAQTLAKRLLEAAAKIGVNVRVEFPDGTIVTTTQASSLPISDDAAFDLERWMKKHHANPT